MFTQMVAAVQVNSDRMRELLDVGFLTATELADELTRRGMPFRQAHEATAAAVRYAQTKGKQLNQLTITELRQFIKSADSSLLQVLDPAQAVALRNHEGGTAPCEVLRQIKIRRKQLTKKPAKS